MRVLVGAVVILFSASKTRFTLAICQLPIDLVVTTGHRDTLCLVHSTNSEVLEYSERGTDERHIIRSNQGQMHRCAMLSKLTEEKLQKTGPPPSARNPHVQKEYYYENPTGDTDSARTRGSIAQIGKT